MEDIPALWNEKMHAYLGLDTIGNYRNGCMQDIHWTDGAFGYFPTYTLGAMYAAQLFHSVRQALLSARTSPPATCSRCSTGCSTTSGATAAVSRPRR